MRFKICIPRVLKHEGGFVNHKNDAGGATNKGITIATFRRFIKPKGTVADLKAMTTEQAIVVYKRQYWDAVSADMLPVGVDHVVFDYAVNSGPSRAAKSLQKALGVAVDGRIGPQTIAAAKARPAADIVHAVCNERLAFMKRAKNSKTNKPLWRDFGREWTKRVERVRASAISDAASSRRTPKFDLSKIIAAILRALGLTK